MVVLGGIEGTVDLFAVEVPALHRVDLGVEGTCRAPRGVPIDIGGRGVDRPGRIWPWGCASGTSAIMPRPWEVSPGSGDLLFRAVRGRGPTVVISTTIGRGKTENKRKFIGK